MGFHERVPRSIGKRGNTQNGDRGIIYHTRLGVRQLALTEIAAVEPMIDAGKGAIGFAARIIRAILAGSLRFFQQLLGLMAQ